MIIRQLSILIEKIKNKSDSYIKNFGYEKYIKNYKNVLGYYYSRDLMIIHICDKLLDFKHSIKYTKSILNVKFSV